MTNPVKKPDIPAVNPWDKYNQEWVSFVHPTDWENPTPKGRYNLLVIGGGPAGLVTAYGAAGLGAKVALVEKHLLGGDCLNVGCVPSKALISAGKAYARVRDAEKYGVQVPPGVTVDFGAVMERMRKLRSGISHHDSAERLKNAGIDVFLGEGEFSGPQSFQMNGKTIHFSGACIATGARAAAPPIKGLEEIHYLTNETLFTLTKLPAKLAVIGAGPIGCEMSQAFRRFGSEVYLMEALHGILTKDDPEASAIVQAALEREGVHIHCCGKNIEFSAQGEQKRLRVSSHGEDLDLTVDQVLMAVGRKPNVEGLGLEKAGVEWSRKGIIVNDRLQSTNKNIFAAGDIASKYQFTHSADFMARIVIGNALFFGRSKASSLVIPWCTYTEPELAHVGKSAQELEKEGVKFNTYKVNLNEVDRAILDGEEEGFVKVHADKKGRILGATLVAAHGGDLIGEISLAMTNGITLGNIAKTIHPYPTQAEAIRKVGDAYNRTRLTPWIKSLMETILRWRR